MNSAHPTTTPTSLLSREQRVQRYGDVICRLNLALAEANLYNIMELYRLTGVDARILIGLREHAGERERFDMGVFSRLCRVLDLPLRSLLAYYTPEQLAEGKDKHVILPDVRVLTAPPAEYGHIRCRLPELMREWEREHQSQKLSNARWAEQLGVNVETLSKWVNQKAEGIRRLSLAKCCHFFGLGEDGVERLFQYDPPAPSEGADAQPAQPVDMRL